MFKIFCVCRSIVANAKTTRNILKKNFFTESFECKETWRQRLEPPFMKRINLENFYNELENMFQQRGNASTIDVDIFSNTVNDNLYLDELEDIIHKLRLSSEATNILPSTHHAFIRAFLSFGDQEELMRILNDRLNYGIFPDDYCSILMMDKFLKSKYYAGAAKVAVLHMLQEDFSNPIILYFSLYSCHKYLLSPTEWEKKEPVIESTGDDEEEIRVRVKYIRNPFFDEHFDLRNEYDLIGKTLMMAGSSINDSLGSTYHLIGLCLFKKYNLASNYLEKIINDKVKIFGDGLTLIKNNLTKLNFENAEDNSDKENVERIENFMNKIDALGLTENESLEAVTESRLKKLVTEKEPELIANQNQVYEDWLNQRQILLQKEVDETKRLKRLEEVVRLKEELVKKEDELFFFEREDEWDLKIENKKVIYPKKWMGKKKKKKTETDEYVPPEITRSTRA